MCGRSATDIRIVVRIDPKYGARPQIRVLRPAQRKTGLAMSAAVRCAVLKSANSFGVGNRTDFLLALPRTSTL